MKSLQIGLASDLRTEWKQHVIEEGRESFSWDCVVLYRLLLPYERFDKGRNIEKKQSKHLKDEPNCKDKEDNSSEALTEDSFSKPRRVGFFCTGDQVTVTYTHRYM